MTDYWNHNTAYHPWVLALVRGGDVLDVGCGDGLLAQRMAPLARSVRGIDPDPESVRRARARLTGIDNVSIDQVAFSDLRADTGFDLITFVGSLHHLDVPRALAAARDMLRPGGHLAVVGLSANTTAVDWLWSALCLPAVRLGSLWHRETRDIGVAVARPRENLAEIRRIADDLLPCAHIRRGLYYRYLLRWQRPQNS
ncbi:class I SAM-dependent methyltransferase [Mycolicibacterium sp. 018/SC-01/001]|uniref:class I SAM-dependent methyltransferase n=1 Tax=Mycolicibacterium sp. 018/SC-01/001 TaxID=2592069 RepID=UPI00118019A7|nr:class I SAM-dependent methyltransferase [Mycolicibacterium sp. 018/SC-01/001]TRW88486.1 class I SAM-dependent methyltransferase [Mycolicibacterium sp. 018/SC-01/001]